MADWFIAIKFYNYIQKSIGNHRLDDDSKDETEHYSVTSSVHSCLMTKWIDREDHSTN